MDPNLASTAANLAKKSLDVTTSATLSTLKGTGKAAFYLASPKHVSREEIWGIWRLDQVLLRGPDRESAVSCAANVELTPKGDVVTKYKEEEYQTVYLFKSRSWPRSCSIEFEARAFQGPGDDVPVSYLYKGTFRRKMADRGVVKIVGKVYEIPKKGGFWRKGGGASGPGVEVGSFVARRRISRQQEGRGVTTSKYKTSSRMHRNEFPEDEDGYDDTDLDTEDYYDVDEDDYYDDKEECDDSAYDY